MSATHDIFLSYARTDCERVRPLVEAIEINTSPIMNRTQECASLLRGGSNSASSRKITPKNEATDVQTLSRIQAANRPVAAKLAPIWLWSAPVRGYINARNPLARKRAPRS